MVSVKGGIDDSEITNSIFISEDHKESSTIPHSPVLESEAAKEGNNSATKKEESNAVKGKRMILQNTHLVPLIISMGVVAVILQIPLVLYYTDPPSTEVTLLENVDLETCSVSL